MWLESGVPSPLLRWRCWSAVGWQEPTGRLSCQVNARKTQTQPPFASIPGKVCLENTPCGRLGNVVLGALPARPFWCAYRCCSGVTQPDSVPVLLLVMLPFSTDSVSLCEGLAQLSSFDSTDSWKARRPEFSLKLLSDGKRKAGVSIAD